MYSQRLQRVGRLWEELGPWTALACWAGLLTGAVALVDGPKWLYESLVFGASLVSAWILLQIMRLYWHDGLAWLLHKKAL